MIHQIERQTGAEDAAEGRDFPRWAAVLFAWLCLFSASQESAAKEPRQVSGPWGTLEYFEIALEPPATQLWDSLFMEETIWDFPLPDQASVLRVLESLQFPAELRFAMQARGVWGKGLFEDHTQVMLDDDLVEMIGPDQRLAITEWWQEHHRDFLSRLIVNIETGNLEHIERRVGAEIRSAVERVAYHRGAVYSTIDRAYVLRRLGSLEEKQAFIRAIFTSHTLVARLVLEEGSDLEGVVEYWSAQGKNPEVSSIIRGLYYAGGVEKLDIVHLMPPIAKKYLFAFTRYQDINPFNAPDCFWTAHQFFRPAMSQRVLDSLPLEYYLGADFELVSGDPAFGDVICIFEPDTQDFLHAYVHVAGPIVFTKNGTSFIRPHVLTTFDQMMSVYEESDRFVFQVYRRRTGT